MLEKISCVLLLNVGVVKKRDERKQNEFRKKLVISESEISEWTEIEVKSKIGNIFVNEKILEEYSVKVNKIDPYFYEYYKKKKKKKKNTS